MKLLTILFMITCSLYSAEVDTKLFDGNNTISYYEAVKSTIDKNVPENQTDTDRIATERLILEKLTKLLNVTPKTNPLPDAILISDKNITSEQYHTYLEALTETYETIETLKDEELNMQSKRKYLKKSINDITTEDKKNLLLYQLQYAFYKLKGNNHTLLIKSYETLLSKGEIDFKEALKKVNFNIATLEKTVADADKKLTAIEQNTISLNLAKERELIYSETVSEDLKKKFLDNTASKMSQMTTKIDQKLLLALAYVQKTQGQKSLDYLASAKEDIHMLTPEIQKHYNYKSTMLKNIFKDLIGNVALALSSVENSAEDMYEYIYKKLTENLFVFNEQGISALDIGKVLLIIILGFMLAAFYKRKIMNLAINREKISISSAKAISSLGYYLIAFITFIIALNSIGLDLSNLGMIAGALSIGIGFGLQTVVSNLAAGIILMFERTIRLGDYIEVSDTIRGTVSDMKMRSTTVTTNDNIDVIIPNSSFIQNNVINWTLENDVRRIHIPFSVAYGTDNARVEEVIMEELKHTNINYVKNVMKYPTVIWMTAMGSSSVDYELIVWVRGKSTTKPSGTKSDFLKFIYAALNKHKIEIPFPQLDLHVKPTGKEISIDSQKEVQKGD
ncbi:MAG: Unknown protein [uncultured Sulfurovum sp.]|uniref:Mechanosensitive ion channel MscS domain-containing protein n=1 Tax=uncultured Sulfurovum sp. TaxID=269237 RepID=A0A6S6U228_9BACT|nr:MAG: Unknown protein [uncultured Sulfurovum sp.]